MVAATACTTPIPTASLSTLFVDALLVAIMGLGHSNLMAAFAGSGIRLALEHLAAARYLGASAMRSIAGSMRSISHQIDRMRQSNSSQTSLQQRIAAGADAAARVASSQRQTQLSSPSVNSFGVQSTQALNGGASQPRGYRRNPNRRPYMRPTHEVRGRGLVRISECRTSFSPLTSSPRTPAAVLCAECKKIKRFGKVPFKTQRGHGIVPREAACFTAQKRRIHNREGIYTRENELSFPIADASASFQ